MRTSRVLLVPFERFQTLIDKGLTPPADPARLPAIVAEVLDDYSTEAELVVKVLTDRGPQEFTYRWEPSAGVASDGERRWVVLDVARRP